MHEITRDFLVSIAAFACGFGIIYVVVITRYRERMAMLEKGVDPASFARSGDGSKTLKFGMLCVGVALGILLGNLLHKNELLDRAAAYFSMTFLFGGVSLILNYIIERKVKRQK